MTDTIGLLEKATNNTIGQRIKKSTNRESPLTQQVRYLDKLVDELAKGKKMEKWAGQAFWNIKLPLPHNKLLMSEFVPCPKCHCEYTYPSEGLLICSECSYEWNPEEVPETAADEVIKVLDVNGNELQNGDSIIVIKDLPVKGMPRPVKAGTKVKNIRLTDGDHNIDCKIDGFGAMGLKSEFVRKA